MQAQLAPDVCARRVKTVRHNNGLLLRLATAPLAAGVPRALARPPPVAYRLCITAAGRTT